MKTIHKNKYVEILVFDGEDLPGSFWHEHERLHQCYGKVNNMKTKDIKHIINIAKDKTINAILLKNY